MTACHPVGTPGVDLPAETGDDEELDSSLARLYRTCVGKAMFIAPERYDAAYAIKECARMMAHPTN
eukprot:15446347-Alexandrium_andersonii.AAC.1